MTISRGLGSGAKTLRLSLDVDPEMNRRLRLAAAKRELTVRQYLLGAIEARLARDLGHASKGTSVLTAKADPLLAVLWDNCKNRGYDRQPGRSLGLAAARRT